MTDTSVPQRAQDLDQAKQLLRTPGYPNGFKTQMNVAKTVEVPQYAQLVQAAAKQIGVEINLVVQDLTTYYGDGDLRELAVARLDHEPRRLRPPRACRTPARRAAPVRGHVERGALQEPGVRRLVAAVHRERPISRSSRRSRARSQTLLLDETPIIFAYFYKFLSAFGTNVSGVVTTAVGQVFLDRASISA